MPTVAALLLCIVLSAPATPPNDAPAAPEPASAPGDAGYKLAAGPNRAAFADLTLADAARGIELPIRVRYPVDAKAPAPLVLFSHGMGGSSDAFAALTEHWASYGYVVILPTHADSLRRQKAGEAGEFLRDPKAYRRRVDPEGRVADLRLILDSLDEIESKIPALRSADGCGRIDRARIAVAGHSAGALTTQMAIGVKVRTRESLRLHSVADARIDAAIVISGQGTTSRMLAKDSWSDARKPMLVIAGSKDTSPASDETPASRREPFELAPAADKYLLFIEGATHSSYQGPGAASRRALRLLGEKDGPDLNLIGDAVSSQTTAFLDAYLRDDRGARDYLVADRIARMDSKIEAAHK